MSKSEFKCIANWIRGIAEDMPRYIHVRGKNRDVVPPMTVPHRNGVVLEDGRQTEMAG